MLLVSTIAEPQDEGSRRLLNALNAPPCPIFFGVETKVMENNRRSIRNYRAKPKSNKIDLWVVRLDKFGNLKGSIPCNICLLAMKGKIRRVYYSTDDGCIAMMRVRDVSVTYNTRSQREHKCDEKIKEYNF